MQKQFKDYIDNFLSTHSIENDLEINLVFEIINDLLESGCIKSGKGYCLAMSDLLQKILSFSNIDSYLLECSLLIVDSNFQPPYLTRVGYENTSKVEENSMQNHVVLVTKTKIPLIIDLSVFEISNGIPFVIGRFNDYKQDINNFSIASLKINNTLFKYSKKPVSSIPYLHQQSIIDRIDSDKKIFSDLKLLKKVIVLLILISGVNFIRGAVDYYKKYVNMDNGFGPNQIFIDKK